MAGRGISNAKAVKAQILDSVLESADRGGWENVRLYHVADVLSLPLEEVHSHFPDLNAVADAWFTDALCAMLVEEPDGFAERPPKERLQIKLRRWLDHLASHRPVTAQMIRAKLHPPHAHHWVPMVFDLSRLIHWWLDSARIASTGPRRAAAEVGLTGIFLMTLAHWARDSSPGQEDTALFLERRLVLADRIMHRWETLGTRRKGLRPTA